MLLQPVIPWVEFTRMQCKALALSTHCTTSSGRLLRRCNLGRTCMVVRAWHQERRMTGTAQVETWVICRLTVQRLVLSTAKAFTCMLIQGQSLSLQEPNRLLKASLDNILSSYLGAPC